MAFRTNIGYMNPETRPTDMLGDKESRHKTTVKREVLMRDARQEPSPPTLERNGVVMVPLHSALEGWDDYHDSTKIRAVYYPEVLAAMKELFGAEHLLVLAHATRSEDPVAEGKRSGFGTFSHAYARFAHLDSGPQTERYVRKQLRKKLPGITEEDTSPKNMDVAMANLWKPYDRPVFQNPLAILDNESMDMERDLGVVTFGNAQYGTPIYQVRESPRHKWLFWSKQEPHEALVFKQFDTRDGHAGGAPHTSFDDPTAPRDAPGRRSVEVTVLMGFPKKKAASSL